MAGGRTFLIKLLGDSKSAEQAFKKTAEVAGGFNKKMLLVGGAIAGVFTAIIGGTLKVGKALLDLGQEFDDVFDNIRIQTGATGRVFEELQESFRSVASQVPNDFADIGTAIQDLNTRLGLTGQPLEDLAIQLLTVSRLMKGDVAQNVRVTTRLFGDFRVAAEDQADVLDLLFVAAQASGQTFETLADQTVNYGADLRALGFTLPKSVAALALFERAGVNTENVMSGLRRAVANLAKDGEDIPTAFDSIIKSIRDASTEADAFSIAVELVGTRYAANLLDTIRGGKFDLDEFIATIEDSSGAIMRTAEDTDGLREAWQNFKNYIKLELEPVANTVFSNLETFVENLRPAVDRVKAAFEKDGLQGALEQVAKEWDRIYNDPDIGIKALWERFKEYLQTDVLPFVLDFAAEVGSAIFSGMVNGFNDAVKNLGLKALGLPANYGEYTTISVTPVGTRSTPSTSTVRQSSGGSVSRVTRLAEGGIVTRPTFPALIGEAGPEAVIPLDRLGSMGTTINLTVNGALDAEGTARTIIRVLEDAQRRTGARLVL